MLKESNCRHDCTGLCGWNTRTHWHPKKQRGKEGSGINCPEQIRKEHFRTSQALAASGLHLHWSLALGRVNLTHYCPGCSNPLLAPGTPCYWPETLNGLTSSHHSNVIHANKRLPHPYINSIPSSGPVSIALILIALLNASLTKEKATMRRTFQSAHTQTVQDRLDTWWEGNK